MLLSKSARAYNRLERGVIRLNKLDVEGIQEIKRSLARGTDERLAHDLAVKLGKHNVRQMLREMTAVDWLKWKVYMGLAPFDESRMDYRIASLVKSLWDVAYATNTKKQNQMSLKDYMNNLRFGDTPMLLEQSPLAYPQEQSNDEWSRIMDIITTVPERNT